MESSVDRRSGLPDGCMEIKQCHCGGVSFDAYVDLEPAYVGIVRCVACSTYVEMPTLIEAINAWNEADF